MIYRCKVTIAGVKSFLREYELKPDMTLFKFNSYINNDLDFSPDQMVLFCGVDENGNTISKYGMFDLGFGSMDRVTIGDLIAKEEYDLHYYYDLRNDKYLVISFVEEDDEQPRVTYPRTITEKGRNPGQFDAKYEDWDSFADNEIVDEEEIADFGEEAIEE